MENLKSIREILSFVSDSATVITLVFITFYGFIKKHKNLLGLRINEFISFILRSAILAVFFILITYITIGIYFLILSTVKLNGNNLYWEKGNELPHIIAYCISGSFGLTLFWFVATIIWTGSFKYIRSVWDNTRLKNLFTEFTNSKELLVENAIYQATPDNFFDVTSIIQKMITNNSLIITASNSLAGDPLRYTPKNLIIRYRFGKNGELNTVTVPEGKTLTLKTKDSIKIE